MGGGVECRGREALTAPEGGGRPTEEPGETPAESSPPTPAPFAHQRLQGGQRDEDSDLTLLLAFRRALVTLGRCDAEVKTRFPTV